MGAKLDHGGLWTAWIAGTLLSILVAAIVMTHGGAARRLFLIGKTTDAHHQIEMACNACHISWFGGRKAIETACLSCHGADLENANDNHPAKKFRDPRNADRLARLDATKCLTCHVEHRPDITGPMAVTLPMDYCLACHRDIGEDRPSHQGLAFETCASAGCHNFHDNRALYEDFLEKHLMEPAVKADARLALVGRREPAPARSQPAFKPDAPAGVAVNAKAISGWLESGHASAGVNCSGCHQPQGATATNGADTWIEKPGLSQCAACHASEAGSFTKGKHGMRLADDMLMSKEALFGLIKTEALGPMRPELARLPMKESAHGRALGCATCHEAHRFERREAKVEACASCHDDAHTRAYFDSPHFALWQAELSGAAPEGSGVACATCHMPLALERGADGIERALAAHNQNDNLRPNEKMARGVCMDCHGLEFTLDALADRSLIDRNFKGSSSVHVESIDWVEQRMRQRGELR